MEISSGRLKAAFDPITGSLVRLQDTTSKLVHVDAGSGGRSDGRLLRINVPAATWSSRYADSHAQTAVELKREGEGLSITYPELVAATGEPLGISAEVRVAASPAPDELLFTLHLANHGAAAVNEVRFPWIGGWTGIGGKGQDQMALGARRFLDPHAFPLPVGNTYALNHQRTRIVFPVELFAPWVDLSGPGGGLSYLNYMPEPQNGCFSIENLAGYGPGLRLALGWGHWLVLRPGETWTSPPLGLAVHEGDWHQTADRYRQWFEARYLPDPSRRGLRAMMGFQNVFLRGFDGTPIRPLEEIPQVAASGRKYGVDHLCIWDVLSLGNYINHGPHDLFDYPEEERALLSQGLKQAEAEGTHTSALVNFRHPNVALSLHDPALQEQVQRRYDGTARTEMFSGSHHHTGLWTQQLGPESYVFSPFSEAQQERVGRLVREYLDLGYTSLFYDQPFEYYPDYGFLEQGQRPQHTHRAALELIARARELLLQRDPNAIIIGEECDILATPWVDMWMSWSISQPAAAPSVAMTRYAIPQTMIAWVVDSEPARVALAFAMGMYLCLMVHGGEGTLDDEPELARLVGALARLRHATAERTVQARFVDRQGLEVEADEGFVAHSYDSAAGPAVIVAAPGGAARGKVRAERAAFSSPDSPAEGLLYSSDGSVVSVSGDEQEFQLQANEVVVWTL